MRVVVLGGGGFRVPLIHRAMLASDLPVEQLVLHDIDPARLSVIAAVLGADGPPVTATTDLDAALDGADLVFSAVRVGGTQGRVDDERAALALGVLGQETVGAGGLSYALRAVPQARHTAERIADLAPSAWTITMTNPAGVITEVMARTLGERVIGVCDSPSGLVRRALLALGATDAEVDYAGINHLGWLRAVRVDGIDRLPELVHDPVALQRIEEGRLFGPDVIAALGCIPNEYLYWYYAAREALTGVVAAGRTRGEAVQAQQAAFYAAASAQPRRAGELWRAANDERNRTYFAEVRDGERDEADVASGGYEGIALAAAGALFGDEPARLILNVRNGSCLTGLPTDAVVEVPCVVDGGGAHPVAVAPLTLHQLGLLAQVRASERAIVEAALTGSREAALRAFLTHPLVGSLEAARALATRW